MELLGSLGYRPLARYFAMDFGFLGLQPARLEQHSDGRARYHLLRLEFLRTAGMNTNPNFMKVIIYSAPSCVYCKMLKDYLAGNGIHYEEKDVVSDLKAREEMIQKSHQMGVPVTDIDGEIFVGFNRTEIARKQGIRQVQKSNLKSQN